MLSDDDSMYSNQGSIMATKTRLVRQKLELTEEIINNASGVFVSFVYDEAKQLNCTLRVEKDEIIKQLRYRVRFKRWGIMGDEIIIY